MMQLTGGAYALRPKGRRRQQVVGWQEQGRPSDHIPSAILPDASLHDVRRECPSLRIADCSHMRIAGQTLASSVKLLMWSVLDLRKYTPSKTRDSALMCSGTVRGIDELKLRICVHAVISHVQRRCRHVHGRPSSDTIGMQSGAQLPSPSTSAGVL